MKGKKIASKWLSVLLSVAVIATSSLGGFTGVTASATETTEINVEEAASVDTSVVSDSVSEEPVLEEDNTEGEYSYRFTDSKRMVMNPVESTGETYEIFHAEVTEEVDEEPQTAVEPGDATLVMKIEGMSGELVGVLLDIYNKKYNSTGTDYTKENFTYAQLKEIKEVDLSSYPMLSNVKGIGQVRYATTISMNGTGITEIPAYEFQNNTSLQSIVLPEKLLTIGEMAFRSCSKLTSVKVNNGGVISEENTLPGTLTKVQSGVFRDCKALKQMTLPDFGVPAVLQNATEMFMGCTALEQVTISAKVSVLPEKAFYEAGSGADGMQVTIKEGSQLENIRPNAFQKANMKEIDLSKCTKLYWIGLESFAASETTGDDAAVASIALKKVILPDKASADAKLTIDKNAFFNAEISAMCVGKYTEADEGTIVIPDYVESLGAGAFYKNDSVVNVKLSNNLERINEFTFFACHKLEMVSLNNPDADCKIEGIGNRAFANNTVLKNADFLADMNHLSCIGDESYTIASSKDEIEKIVYFTEKISGVKYGSDVFAGSGITSATFPASLRTINSRAFWSAKNLAKVQWDSDAALETSAAYTIGTDAFRECLMLETFVYPRTARKNATFTIGSRSFWANLSLKKFSEDGTENTDGTANKLPVTLTELGISAFYNCMELVNMQITDNEKGASPHFDEGVFAGCYKLTTVSLPASMTAIPKDTFYDCGLTAFPKALDNAGKEVITPALERIEDGALYGNKMETIDLGNYTNLAFIGPIAFAYTDPYPDVKPEDGTIYTADEILDENAKAPLKKLILPDKINAKNANMAWSSNMLQAADQFTTLATPSHTEEGVVFIPNYVVENEVSHSIFANTGVTQAKWEFEEMTSGANVWTGIPDGMFAMTKVTDISKCCISPNYLKKIGSFAYCGVPITKLDMTQWPLLEENGTGSFALCTLLEEVKLPNNGIYYLVTRQTFHVGDFTTSIGLVNLDPNFTFKSSLKSVDFGKVTTLGSYSFAVLDVEGSEIKKYPDALESVSLKEINLVLSGSYVFAGRDSLKTVDLTGVETVGNYMFYDCDSLCLTETPLPDSIKKIGAHAFEKCDSIGKVVFGTGLQQIGEGAFAQAAQFDYDTSGNPIAMKENVGLESVDLSKATELSVIGSKAFEQTPIKTFDASKNPLQVLKTGTLSNCPYLTGVVLGEELTLIEEDVANGCVRLDSFMFYSTTTINKGAFKSVGLFETIKDDGTKTKYTPVSKVTFKLTTVELNIGIGNPMIFPYFVNAASDDKNKGLFDTVVIGNPADTDSTYAEYVKLYANIGNYYLNAAVKGNEIHEGAYYEKTESVKYSVNNTEVYTFEIEGLKATPADKPIDFSLTCNYSFESDETEATKINGVGATVKAEYKLRVLDIPYYPVLYTDRERQLRHTDLVIDKEKGTATGTTELRVSADDTVGRKPFYYTLKTIGTSTWSPGTGNLVLKTSNPSVVGFSENSNLKKVDATTWKLTVEPSQPGSTDVYNLTEGKGFSLIPAGYGNAVVTIYHEKRPQNKITWNIAVKADVKDVTFSRPAQFKNGLLVGDQFTIIDKIQCYLDKEVSRDGGTLAQLSQYTDNVLVCTSKSPEIASINNAGLVTINSIPAEGASCKFTVSAYRGDKLVLNKEVSLRVAYPPVEEGAAVESSTGETVKVVKAPSAGEPGQVIYTAPKAGTADVTIPATMTVNGQQCNVTAIEEGAFAGNNAVKTLVISEGITNVPDKLCNGCKELTSVVIPTSVVTIGDSAFNGCTKLKTVSLGSSAKLTEIGKNAFYKCTSLTKITIPKKVKVIGDKAFYGCKKLKTVTFHKKAYLTTIGKSTFASCTALKKFTIPYKVTDIGSKAFYKCSKLKTITVKSKKMKTVGKNAFKSIYKRAKISVPKNKKNEYKTLFKKGQPKTVKIK